MLNVFSCVAGYERFFLSPDFESGKGQFMGLLESELLDISNAKVARAGSQVTVYGGTGNVVVSQNATTAISHSKIRNLYTSEPVSGQLEG